MLVYSSKPIEVSIFVSTSKRLKDLPSKTSKKGILYENESKPICDFDFLHKLADFLKIDRHTLRDKIRRLEDKGIKREDITIDQLKRRD